MSAAKDQVQVVLEAGHGAATSRLTCWVDNVPGIKVGNRLTLKDRSDLDHEVWDIIEVSAPHPATDIKRGWNNNI